jgi:hypothetical protein
MELPRTLHRQACSVALAAAREAATRLAVMASVRANSVSDARSRSWTRRASQRRWGHAESVRTGHGPARGLTGRSARVRANSAALVVVVWRSVSGVPAVAANAAQLNRSTRSMIGPGQLPLDPPVALLFKDPQPDLALDRPCLLSIHAPIFGSRRALRFGQRSQIDRCALDSRSNGMRPRRFGVALAALTLLDGGVSWSP